VLEGMAAGCAVVGSAVPGVREVIEDGVNGVLVPESDPEALASALEDLLRDSSRAAALAARARRTALEHHSRERMHRDYEALFVELARQPPRTRDSA